MADLLTDLAVQALQPRETAYLIWDSGAPGLCLRVTPKGLKVWYAQIHLPGKVQSRRAIGKYPATSLAEARDIAKQWVKLAKEGTDPEAVRVERVREAQRKAADNFASVVDTYVAGRTHFRHAKKDEQAIRRVLVPAWGERPISSITTRDVKELIADVIVSRGARSANEAWKNCSVIFKYAVFRELIPASPCASIDRRQLFAHVDLGERERTLTTDEIVALWVTIQAMPYPWSPIYKLLMMTACRLTEVSEARWVEFDPEVRRALRDGDWASVPNEHRFWTIPAERSKTETDLVKPITDAMFELLKTLPRDGEHLFSIHGRAEPVHVGSKVKARVDQEMLANLQRLAQQRGENARKVTLEPWVNHDIRRTVRSELPRLGVAEHVAERVLGHAITGIEKVYNKYSYVEEVRDALTKWHAWVLKLVDRNKM